MARRNTAVVDLGRLVDRDLTELARAGRLAIAFGVDGAVTELLALIGRGDKHPLLAGDPGVGKTALVQEAARRIVEGKIEPSLSEARVVEISIATVLARGEKRAAESLDELLESLAQKPGTIVYLRDIAAGMGGPGMGVVGRGGRGGGPPFVAE